MRPQPASPAESPSPRSAPSAGAAPGPAPEPANRPSAILENGTTPGARPAGNAAPVRETSASTTAGSNTPGRKTAQSSSPAGFVPPLAPSPPPPKAPTVHNQRSAGSTPVRPRTRFPAPASQVTEKPEDGTEPTENFGAPPTGSVANDTDPGTPGFNRPSFKYLDSLRRVTVTLLVTGSAGAVYYLTRTPDGFPALPAGSAFLDRSSSFLAMVPYAWAAWLPVFAGALSYVVYQWLPAQRTNDRHRWMGWATAAAAVLGTLWLWTAAAGSPALAFWVAILQVAVGLTTIHLVNGWPPSTRGEHLIADVPAGAFLGVSILALLASLGGWLVQGGSDVAGWGAEAWTLIALASVVVGVTTICMTDRGHLSVALTVVWGLGWIGMARLLDSPAAVWPAVSALGAAFLIIVSASSRRHQVDHARRLAYRKWLKAESSARAAGEAPEAART